MIFSLFALGLAAIALLLLGASGPAYRVGVPLPTAFAMLRWGAYLGGAAAVLGIASILYGRWRKKFFAIVVALFATIGGLVAIGIPYSWQRKAQSVPPIHDISTDIENPPDFRAILPLRADAPNKLERSPIIDKQQREGYPDLAPATLSMPLDQAFDRALKAAQDANWDIVAMDKTAGRIEAVDTTRFFGFNDDVAVRLTPWGAGTRVDVRSVSRVGRSDVGTNAERIREYLEAIED